MNVIDTSAWLAWFAEEENAGIFESAILKTEELIVPVICLYEVFKVLLRETSETDALLAASIMQQGRVVDIDPEIALNAAKISTEHKIPMADSMIYAISQKYTALLWTQDIDLKGLPGVKYFEKKS
jgi:predicted nucleic acid-binding protein